MILSVSYIQFVAKVGKQFGCDSMQEALQLQVAAAKKKTNWMGLGAGGWEANNVNAPVTGWQLCATTATRLMISAVLFS